MVGPGVVCNNIREIALLISRHSIFYVFSIVVVLVVLETASYSVVKVLQKKGVFYKPVVHASYQDYLSKRDPLLGWPSPGEFGTGDKYDSSGSRIIPSFPDAKNHQACISLYGDSFTYSSEVDHADAWSNVLSRLLGCRVANYGVGGYGTDQSYLRFKKNADDGSGIVFLNHLSENILRNVNQFRDLLYPAKGLSFTPRFVVNEAGDLDLIPLPAFSAAQYKDVVSYPAEYLSDEYFLPGGPSGVTVAAFPYTVSVARGFKHFHVKSRLRGEPWYLEFYNDDHPSRGLEVTAEILSEFHREALERGKLPVVTIIPTGVDLSYFLEHGVWPFDTLIGKLSVRDIEVFNFGEGILARIDNDNPCLLFDDCSGHYNEKGYKIIAELAYELLERRGLLPRIEMRDRPGHEVSG